MVLPYEKLTFSKYPNGQYKTYHHGIGSKQKPYTGAPMAYTGHHAVQTSYEPGGYTKLPPSGCLSTVFFDTALSNLPEYQVAYNKTRSKFLSKLSDRAQLGATIAEGREAFGMIAQRALQLRQAYKFVRGGNFYDAARVLKIAPGSLKINRKWKSARPSELWLEYWFGWAPLIGDIATAVDTLQKPIPDYPVTVVSGNSVDKVATRENSREIYWRGGFKGSCRFKMSARVKVANPNLWEANRLGLVNPFTIAWELVPFSFVVDWFIPVGDFIEGYTDTAGLSFHDSYWTRYLVLEGENDYVGNKNYPAYRFYKTESAKLFHVTRTLGEPPRPYLTVQMADRLSITRAATAISLLIELFLTGKK